MLVLLKKIWKLFATRLSVNDGSRICEGEANSPDEDPLPDLEPPESGTHYVLPRRWSLHYALTKKQWSEFRHRLQQHYQVWERCSCPKGCKANTLDEIWRYESSSHTKILQGAKFICPGCHWRKTPPWRIQTWLELESGQLIIISKPPHIIDCLGWTQKQVDALRDRDLKEHQELSLLLAQLEMQVQKGTAAILPAPPDQLSPQDLKRLLKPGQIMVVLWRIDLSALSRFGFSQTEIVMFEERMRKLASKRMAGQ